MGTVEPSPGRWLGALLLVALSGCSISHSTTDSGTQADHGTLASDAGQPDLGPPPDAGQRDLGPRPDAGPLDCGVIVANIHYVGAGSTMFPPIELVVGETPDCERLGILATPMEAAQLSELPWVRCENRSVGSVRGPYLCQESAAPIYAGVPLTEETVDGLCWIAAVAPHDPEWACVRPTF